MTNSFRSKRPAERLLSLLADDLLDHRPYLPSGGFVLRQEHETGSVGARSRQRERQPLAKEAIRELHQDAGAVAGVRVGPGRAPVLQVHQQFERLADDLV